MNTDALTGKAINRAHAIDELLRKHYPAAKGRSLHAVLKCLAHTLPAVLVRTITVVAKVRDAAAHPGGSKPFTLPPDFDRLCDEIELLIPYFADRQRAKPDQAPKKPKPSAPKPPINAALSKPANNDTPANRPANHGKPWTRDEDKQLTDAFAAHSTIPALAKAHQRGVGGIQNRLTKLGKLPAAEYKTYPPEP